MPSFADRLVAAPTGRLTLALLSATSLLAAFLLFWVEPFFARLVLPLLGGSPAVWNTCLMYFQAALLCGYLYAHVITRYLTARHQVMLHLALLALAFVALPLVIPAGWAPPASDRPIGWLLGLLTVAVGAPFLLLSATAPLLQRWLAGLDDPAAANPYPLYAASNAGSFLGLLAFPFVLEPRLRLSQQSALWSAGYLGVGVLVALCGVLVWRRSRPESAPVLEGGATSPAPSAWERVRWVALAFVPSSLLLGVTNYLTTDIAAVPFLWVLPLALYLLTFVVVFARSGRTPARVPLALHALLVTVFVLVAFWRVHLDQRWAYPLHLGLFAVTALVLHGELAAARPSPRHLTGFYLWMSVGGALGGAFNALAAPVLFDTVAEYLPMVVLACFLRPSSAGQRRGRLERLETVAVAALPALLLGVVLAFGFGARPVLGTSVAMVASVAAGVVVLAQRANALVLGASLAAVGGAGVLLRRSPESVLHAERSFFGSYRVVETRKARFLYHGTTIHGAQLTDSARRLRPVTYYHPEGPAGRLFAAFGPGLAGRRIGVVGLGVGSLLCYGRADQTWTFFEIDPAVERMARDPRYFTFLRDCPAQATVVLGDARLTLAAQPPGRFAVLVLDAFSSDAIPVHLLTREALAIYRRVLEPGGVLLVHISNRHLSLLPVIAALAADAGMAAYAGDQRLDPKRESEELDYGSDWVVLSEPGGAGPLAGDPGWTRLAPTGRRPWTDDYSNVFGAIRW